MPMNTVTRREFLTRVGVGVGAIVTTSALTAAEPDSAGANTSAPDFTVPPVDFRYTPLSYQTAFCFPDDPYKSLVGQKGELRMSRNPCTWPQAIFPEQVDFSFLGMEANTVTDQHLEAPDVPIVHTIIERAGATARLITFATRRPNEGRVDNVLIEVVPRGDQPVQVIPVMIVHTPHNLKPSATGPVGAMHLESEKDPPFVVANRHFGHRESTSLAVHCTLERGQARPGEPYRIFFRFPQEKQAVAALADGVATPDVLLAEARRYWADWKAFGGSVTWKLANPKNNFLLACARNILQAREVRDGKLTFQVGPTCYRGLWVVDGNFILEAAKYLGYDEQAQEGLQTTWSRQQDSGGIFAGGGPEHWKDTGIAMFTLVRLAELSQDWTYFKSLTPNVLKAVRFLRDLRDNNRKRDNPCARYGLLAPGFCDGGVGGLRSEFTNTLWVLAGLRAVAAAGARLGMTEHNETRAFYDELRTACFNAMRQEMRKYPTGFEYLPMVMKDDPGWTLPNAWDRLRPQGAQWALSHAIFPGLVFDKNDPVVQGHIRLMQAVTEEDIPKETGWLPREGVWTYNAAFVAHVYLWAGLSDWARRTFVGFLNHASPLYCWREEQPLRRSLVATYIGDMPHNWASAMCILYLRHMLALEDSSTLRLLAGVGDYDLAAREPYSLTDSPTRFGRISLRLQPEGNDNWHLEFRRATGPTPERVLLPAALGSRLKLADLSGATFKRVSDSIEIAPEASKWTATWTP